MKIINYNILRGGQFEAGNRLGKIIDFIKSEDPDIVGLLECDQFHSNDNSVLNFVKKELNMRAIYHQTPSAADMVLLYKDSVEMSQGKTYNRFMFHGLICADFKKNNTVFRVILTHLNPYSSELRLAEAQIITQLAHRQENSVIFGDFNCPPYKSNIIPRDFKKTFFSRVSNHLGDLDLRATQNFQSNGFLDLFECTNPTNLHEGSYPTPLGNKDEKYPTLVRIDNFYASRFFQTNCTSVEIKKNKSLDFTSDHYPLICNFNI
ncbi:MAG: hypothetical protein COB02_05095 [Candidatus Cloacimonadota bacterium]|nr:MAG: hypothetical protein COB02_05095 [Candidatus Cloacimonadota bacterium]